MTGFSGSYESADVTFLLKPIEVRELDVEAKERHIQSAGGHYSEVLSAEAAPAAEYLALFNRQLQTMKSVVARDVLAMAHAISAGRTSPEVTVVSLARAGTPIGVLTHRALKHLLGRDSQHFCVSIIRDRGLDANALKTICAQRQPEGVAFVDGWTGKGVIGRELRKSVDEFNLKHGTQVSSALHVLSDIAGTADFSATTEDYLLPSAVLNATVSGLVSRTVLNEQIGPDDFHGCVQLKHLGPWDQTRHFIDVLWDEVLAQFGSQPLSRQADASSSSREPLAHTLERYLAEFALPGLNFVKPGVGEATRVMLRRKPLLLVLRDASDPHVEHLVHLARQRGVPLRTDSAMPCKALALIDKPD